MYRRPSSVNEFHRSIVSEFAKLGSTQWKKLRHYLLDSLDDIAVFFYYVGHCKIVSMTCGANKRDG